MATLYLKQASYQGEGKYRLVVSYPNQQVSTTFGSFNKQDDYYDTYVWKITNNEINEENKSRTPCE